MTTMPQTKPMQLETEAYSVDRLDSLLEDWKFIKTPKKIEYADVPMSFDIETTSTYIGEGKNKKKIAFMYCFVLGINGKVIFGRTWEEVIKLFKAISKHYGLSKDKRMICYVQNLSFEFQFICKRFKWLKVFATDERKPLTALADIGIEFRCSYFLSGYSLEKIGENLQRYKVIKLVGDLDYSRIRHSKTFMDRKERQYVINDALVVMAYIQEQIEDCGNITKIPLTKTGFVRKYCKDCCLYPLGHTKKNTPKYWEYRRIIEPLTITSPQMYEQLKRAFQGGFTHANALWSGQVIEDVTSFDFTSSYPAVLVGKKYPMTKFKLVEIHSAEDFRYYIDNYACMFDVTFEMIESKDTIDNPISAYKCWQLKEETIDNGRVSDASVLSTTITELDYLVIKKFYRWKRMYVKNMRVAMKGYLPTNLVKAILKLYEDKTSLKDVEGKEVEYLRGKSLINAVFGMAVTDVVQDEYTFGKNGWSKKDGDIVKSLNKYNDNKSRYLFYAWGIWCTAWARYNLFTGISEFGTDYIYSDTDSIKVIRPDLHKEYLDNYNKNVIKELEDAMDYHGLDRELIRPKTIKGIEKPLGVWDFDGHYKFKTLGAKRYMVEYDDGHHSLTISGVNKKTAIPYLEAQAKEKGCTIFDLFNDGLTIPSEWEYEKDGKKVKTNPCGKNTHTYLDEPQKGLITDYLGVQGEYDELSSVHIEPAEYSLGLASQYLDYIFGIQGDING